MKSYAPPFIFQIHTGNSEIKHGDGGKQSTGRYPLRAFKFFGLDDIKMAFSQPPQVIQIATGQHMSSLKCWPFEFSCPDFCNVMGQWGKYPDCNWRSFFFVLSFVKKS
jgi:hypothetical protein